MLNVDALQVDPADGGTEVQARDPQLRPISPFPPTVKPGIDTITFRELLTHRQASALTAASPPLPPPPSPPSRASCSHDPPVQRRAALRPLVIAVHRQSPRRRAARTPCARRPRLSYPPPPPLPPSPPAFSPPPLPLPPSAGEQHSRRAVSARAPSGKPAPGDGDSRPRPSTSSSSTPLAVDSDLLKTLSIFPPSFRHCAGAYTLVPFVSTRISFTSYLAPPSPITHRARLLIPILHCLYRREPSTRQVITS